LSIAIGIAAVVSVSLGTATTRQAYRQMYEELSGRAALQITAIGAGFFPQDLADKVQKVSGVRAAVPSLQRPIRLTFEHEWLDLMLMGIDPAHDTAAREYELREGRFLQSNTEPAGLLEISFAEGAGIHLGDQVRVMTPRGGLKGVTIVGLLGPRGAAGFNKGGALFVPLGFGERYFGRRGEISTIDIVLNDGADKKAVAAAIEPLVPPGLDLHEPATTTQQSKTTMVEIEQGLYLASALAMVLAFIIIVNTFLMNASERRPQLAILRAVGATRGQIIRMLLGESLGMGVVGTVLGCLVGLVGGYFLMTFVSRIYVGTPPPIIFGTEPFVLAAVVGPTVAVLAALVPALLTTRISPLEALQPMVSQSGSGVPRWLPITGMVGGLTAGLLLLESIRGWGPPWFAILFGVAFITLFVLILPVLVRPLSGAIAWLLRPLMPMEVRLSQRQVVRRPVRSALTAGVVYIAASIGVGLGSIIITTVGDVRQWARESMVGDFFLRAAFPNTTTGQTVVMPGDLEQQIRQIPGVTSVDSVRFFNAKVAGRSVFVIAREFNTKDLSIDLYDADADTVRRELREGQIVVGTVLAQQLGIKPGDELTVSNTREGPKTFRVAALAIDYMVGGNILFMYRPMAVKLFDVEGINSFLVMASRKSLPEVRSALADIARQHKLLLHSFADLTAMVDRMMGGVVGGLWGVLALSFVVAMFGIANTLTMNVLEQTRELAMLRVVAMTRRQVRRLVLMEAAIIGILGLGLGTASGVTTAYSISQTMGSVLGYPTPFMLHPWLIVGSVALGLLLVMLAAFGPAQRAARLDLLIALQYE
jgi:putative ABC transport system permease protein